MAAKDLDRSDIKKQHELEDITTCCICTEVYTDPKALPCIHTFCMKCLRETGFKSNKGPGDEMPCPICRRLFKIPTEGFPGLPKHFFIERLIQVSKASDPSSVTKALCSVCLEKSDKQKGTETPTADAYCVVCKTNLCKECRNEHRKFKLTKNHKLMPINEYISDQNLISDLACMVCEVHAQRFVDVYCADCKVVVCAICFIEEHKNHEGSDVNKCVDGYRKQIENNTETMNGCIAQAQMKKAELVMVKEQMQKRTGSLESDIDNRKRHIMQFADKHASSLLQDLCYERQSRLKEIQMTTDDIDAYLSTIESYNSYCQRIMTKGSASDICSAHSDLSVRAMELQEQCQPIIERGIEEFKFCFRQSELEEFLEEHCGNLVGEIEKEDDLKPKKTSKRILIEEQRKEIDILRQKNNQLSEWRANYNAHMEKLKEELENNKTAIHALQVDNDKLRQEVDVEKSTSNSLQTSNVTKKYDDYKAHREKLKQDLEKNKTEFNALQVSNDKLRQELDVEETTLKTLEAEAEKLISELVESRYKSDPILVQTIRIEGSNTIRGLAILDKELFVVSWGRSRFNVYDLLALSFSRQLKLMELFFPFDMTSCYRNKCLYILGCKHRGHPFLPSEIVRVDPNGKLIKKWITGDDRGSGLSVTDESNVILTVDTKNKLNEYSSDGQLIREIHLSDADIRDPWHAIKLTNGNFVVCHGRDHGELRRVCIVDADGNLKKSFDGKSGSNIEQLNFPVHLTVDGNGFVMVLDYLSKSRVLLLNSDLEFKREIVRLEKHGNILAFRLLMNESNCRLFVADDTLSRGNVLTFDFI